MEANDPGLVELLESLVEPLTRGDPESPLRWTCKSTRTLAGELVYRRHPISHQKVAQYLRRLGYSLQGNRKTEGRARTIPTGTLSSDTSTERCGRPWQGIGR